MTCPPTLPRLSHPGLRYRVACSSTSSPPSSGSFEPAPPTTGASWQEAQPGALKRGPSPCAGVKTIWKTALPCRNRSGWSAVSPETGPPTAGALAATSAVASGCDGLGGSTLVEVVASHAASATIAASRDRRYGEAAVQERRRPGGIGSSFSSTSVKPAAERLQRADPKWELWRALQYENLCTGGECRRPSAPHERSDSLHAGSDGRRDSSRKSDNRRARTGYSLSCV